ncbi:hypothetical protein [Sandaracinus amylolyticus]|uniref:hypothetical protein n=1 Tax=Sandaracinus amylolyticus TaxID=927083 RepID=UPI001F41CE77|nr:hypothetical protein [Sandaracinus amylolyticus]
MRRPPLLALIALSLAACGEDRPASTTRTEAPPPAPLSDVEVIAGLAVHEWGVIDVRADRGPLGELALSGVPGRGVPRDELMRDVPVPLGLSPTPTPTPPRPPVGRPRAPLLYVHLPPGHAPIDLSVRVELPGGTIEEHWPLTSDHDERTQWVRWRATARTESCTGSSYPAPGEAPCDQALRFYCEASELRRYEASDAACLEVDGRDFNHLFYRGALPARLPLQITRAEDGTLRVHHAGESALPGRLVLVHREDDPSATRVRVIDVPAPGATISVTTPDAAIDPARDAIYGALRESFALTDAEVAAFRAAWDVSFFGGARAEIEGLRRQAFVPPIDSLFYWLPEREVERIAPLAIEPRPEHVRRAMLIRVDLDEHPRSYLEAATR